MLFRSELAFKNRRSELEVFESELAANQAELDGELKKRHDVFITLPSNLANVYNRLAQRSRDGIAVAEVKNGSCSACFMKLRPHLQVEIKKGNEIITCENCTRILYTAPAESKAATQES